jgi:type III pantothenate kinase
MILTIDIGNTTCKAGIFQNHLLTRFFSCTFDDLIDRVREIVECDPIKAIAICSVRGNISSLKAEFENNFLIFEISSDISLPFKNNYLSATLGNDRLALVTGALAQNKKPHDSLIIDAGTCLTYDYIDKNLNYHGGAISPGLNMRFKSLHTFTSKLPLIASNANTPVIGNTTDSSIRSGVQHGLSMEIDGMISFYREKSSNLKIFLTGGDSVLLSGHLKNRFFAVPYLMLYGIYNLYQYNNEI